MPGIPKDMVGINGAGIRIVIPPNVPPEKRQPYQKGPYGVFNAATGEKLVASVASVKVEWEHGSFPLVTLAFRPNGVEVELPEGSGIAHEGAAGARGDK